MVVVVVVGFVLQFSNFFFKISCLCHRWGAEVAAVMSGCGYPAGTWDLVMGYHSYTEKVALVLV